MARGGLAQQQLNTTNAVAAGQAGDAGQVFGTDWNAVQQQLNPSDATKAALTQTPMNAANAAFAAAQQNATNRVAKTNNSAGYGSQMDDLALKKAQADSAAALSGQNAILNLQNEGVKNAGGLFGTSEDTMAKLYGTSAENTKTATQQHPWSVGIGPIGVKGS